jgi:hypothetical protein
LLSLYLFAHVLLSLFLEKRSAFISR